MNNDVYKKYTIQAKRGIRGEAFFESLVCDYCLPHHIVSPKDVGIDYICEWVYGDRPTGALFAVQVKTFSEETANPKFIGIEERLNGLCKYEIHNTHLKIDKATLHYWKGLGLPVYLFVIVQKATENGGEILDCYYKRFTEILTQETLDDLPDYYKPFYKANEGNSFIAFKNPDTRTLGFARDLFIDHVHWSYYKGAIMYLDPQALGLSQFRQDAVFVDMIQRYKGKIVAAFDRTKQYLERYG